MTTAIAVVGMACRYPDAGSPGELWENVLGQRQAFRRLPAQRLRAEDYYSPDPAAQDRTYSLQAAVLDGWKFDRVRFRIAGSTFRSTDLAHWLALEVAADALSDAGFAEGDGLDRERTGVLVGNTLTGEFSRARVLRLRWPYVRRVVAAALKREQWDDAARGRFLAELERSYKAPFDEIDEDALAGGLSNTIAGRICNAFDLKGGGYTVDGACAASLLAVTTACASLAAGDVDVALAGGVDLSLDPFELVGFAKAGALARDEMRVYDVRSAGFWPGEGCGFVVLMRLEDALAAGRHPHATIRGWGVSSDGRGGITRPELEGQLLALRRAYQRAGFGIDTVSLFEGHGTGTSVGDLVELTALGRARAEAAPAERVAAIGSIKANVGHTKAAAGIAGLIKAAMSLREQVIPPTTGCQEPHEELRRERSPLRIVRQPEPWPPAAPLRAAVSAMGFGGINTHVVLEGMADRRRSRLGRRERRLGHSAQDSELFVLAAEGSRDLDEQLARLERLAPELSRAELADLATELYRRVEGRRPARAAIVAGTPGELEERLALVRHWLEDGSDRVDPAAGAVLGLGRSPPRIGFLFPGQASPTYVDGGALARRFPFVRALYDRASLPSGADLADTRIAQPAIVIASLAGLAVLRRLGVDGSIAVGHSVGELAALHWAGAIGIQAAVELAAARGEAMAELAEGSGAMASIAAPAEQVARLLEGESDVLIAGYNAPRQTVVSGAQDAVARVVKRAEREGLAATRLPVSHAFHSPSIEPAAQRIASYLQTVDFRPPEHPLASTVTGELLRAEADLRALLELQLTSPVRFAPALELVCRDADVLLEVGPGFVLHGLARQSSELPVLSLDAGGPTLRGLLGAVGGLFALGAPLRLATLFAGRFTRPFPLDRRRAFLANPCELAPLDDDVEATPAIEVPVAEPTAQPTSVGRPADPLALVRTLVAERAELPEAAIGDQSRLLGDLHLNSIQVAEIAAAAARELGVAPPSAPTELADVTIAELATALEALEPAEAASLDIEGVASWVRPFTVELVPRSRPQAANGIAWRWQAIVPADYPLAEAAQEAFAGDGDEVGVVLFLPRAPGDGRVRCLLEAARTVREVGARRFAVVQHGGGGAAFARSLHLELPDVAVCVMEAPLEAWVLEQARIEAETTAGFREVVYDRDGRRHVPVLRPFDLEPGELPLTSDDLLLITGGGKGIAAECALSLGRATGARLALLGRSRPEDDADLDENLRRFEAVGVRTLYVPADVTDHEDVRRALARVEAELGEVSAVLHGAGTNVPRLLADLDEDDLHAAIAPKVAGLRNVVTALEGHPLKLLVTFGSIIARTGLRGEAHYAVANEWMRLLLEELSEALPGCRCLDVEWSVWAGTGMGERLGTLDFLMRSGIAPIPIEEGVRTLEQLIGAPSTPTSVVVSGRFGRPPTVELEQTPLPLLRFLERPRVYYPGVELVADAELSAENDPYLADHKLDGTTLFPAVLALEAMAQAATALAGVSAPLAMKNVQFARPITLPSEGRRTIRIAALARGPGEVEVVIRSDDTLLKADHVRAVCRFGPTLDDRPHEEATQAADSPLVLTSESELYDGLLFQGRRFRRLRGYRRLRARACVAEVAVRGDEWFGSFLPATLVLGDPGARDAYIHAIQACIPHERLVPIGVERFATRGTPEGIAVVTAKERSAAAGTFVYDLEVRDELGRIWERWEGLTLRSVGPASTPEAWPTELLAPYLERRVGELTGGNAVSIVVSSRRDTAERRADSDAAMLRASGLAGAVLRRPDGKPEVGGREVSVAHLDGHTLAVAGRAPLACDLETVVRRGDELWRDLLGGERFALARALGSEAEEELEAAATRVWTAAECARKAGCSLREPLTLVSSSDDGWTLLRAGDLPVATFVTRVRAVDQPVAFGFLVGMGPL